MPAVAPNGDLYVIWMHVNEGYNASSYEIRKSTDGGITFGSTITPTHFTLVGPSIGRAKIWNLPSLVTDPITNNLYVTYVDQVSEYDDNLRIKFIRSTNGGGLWSTPSTIGNFGVGWQF